MRALVLTAGLGTRLQPLTLARAKAAAPVDGEPLARRTIRWLVSQGFTDLVLNLHHRPESITAAVGDGGDLGARVRYSWESPVLGSAGGPRHALPLLLDRGADETFVLVNGDTLTNVDVGRLLHAHERSGALVTMAVIPNAEPAKYGGVVVDNLGTVTGFTRAGSTEPSFHFIGVQVVEGAAFVSLPDNMPAESVKDVYPALIAARPGSIRAFITDAEFFDIGTPRDYFDTCMRFRAKEPAGSRLRSPGSRVEDAIVWDDVHIDPQAQLRRCIVTDGVRVPRGSWENMIIRHANGDLAANEQRVDDLAIASIDGSPLR